MRPEFSNTLAIVKLRQKLCFYQGKLSGVYELLDMASEWLSEDEIDNIKLEVENLASLYYMVVEKTKNEIEELQEGELL